MPRPSPTWSRSVNFTKAPAPELPGKIKAQQDADRVDIDLVLTGTRRAVGRRRPEAVGPAAASIRGVLPKLDDIHLPGAVKMQAVAKGQGVVVITTRPAR